MSTNADREGTEGTCYLTLTQVERGEVCDHITDSADKEHNRKLFRTGLVDHKQAKCETRDLHPVKL